MENKIQLRFKLDNLQKIGFSADAKQQELLDWLQTMQEKGIEIKPDFYDDLCKSTISSGHNLLRSKDIFSIDSTVIGPMAKIIGHFLFRLLFGTNDFLNYLHMARKEKKELEIILEFNQVNADSMKIMQLPWELMYCPDRQTEADDDDKEDGFFVSQTATIYRRYKEEFENHNEDRREVYVSVAFLVKDKENLKEVYLKFKEAAEIISKKNSNIHFDFINTIDKPDDKINLLSKEDLSKIFLSNKSNDAGGNINKIVHLVCDISVVSEADKAGNTTYEKALYFNKTGDDTESVSVKEVFKELFNKNVLQDAALKLMVLQAWNDEKNNAYAGFEDIVNRMIKKNQAAIISMPYILNKKDADGKLAFFEALYGNLSEGLSILTSVQKLRNEIVPKFSYGFPLCYLNASDQVLVRKENMVNNNAPKQIRKKENQSDMESLEELKELRSLLLEKKHEFSKREIINSDPGMGFSLKKGIEQIDETLNQVEEKINKHTPFSIRLDDGSLNK